MRYAFTHVVYMTGDELLDLYQAVVEDGHAEILFYDGGITNEADWLKFMSTGKNWLCAVMDMKAEEPRPVGLFWLNGYHGAAAQVHFCIRKGYRDTQEAGRASIEYIREHTKLRTLYGVTPKLYHHAIDYVKTLGFEVKCEIPAACHMAKLERYVPGVISVLDLISFKGE